MEVRKMATSGIVIENPKTGVKRDFTPTSSDPTLDPSRLARVEVLHRGEIEEFDGQEVKLKDGNRYKVNVTILEQDGKSAKLVEVLGYRRENSRDGTIFILPSDIEPYSAKHGPGNREVYDGLLAIRLGNKPSSYYK